MEKIKADTQMARGFTLIELILVIVIIITLALIAIPNYGKSRRRAISKEGNANVKLIAAAERIYRMEIGDYYDCACSDTSTCANTTTGCNSVLRLMLNPSNWTYQVVTSGSAGSKAATITATSSSLGCTYTLTSANFDNEPTPGAGCP